MTKRQLPLLLQPRREFLPTGSKYGGADSNRPCVVVSSAVLLKGLMLLSLSFASSLNQDTEKQLVHLSSALA